MTQEREKNTSSGEAADMVEVQVYIHGKYLVIKVKKGSTRQDVIDKLVEEYGLKREDLETMTITFDGKEVEFKNGEIVEDSVVNETTTLVLLKKFVGGRRRKK